MKLIYCNNCGDIFALRFEDKKCDCGKSGGRYTDRVNAEIYGECTPVGIDNGSFVKAMIFQDILDKAGGSELEGGFNAFIIPKKAKSVKRTDTTDRNT